jgi:hypothetical protein
MPRISKGHIAAGVGGLQASVDGRVLAEPAGGTCWLVPGETVIFDWNGKVYSCEKDGVPFLIDELGANSLAAGSGVYMAWFDGTVRVVRPNEPHHLFPDYYVGDISPDGSNVIIVSPQGTVDGQIVYQLQALDGSGWSGLSPHYRPIASGVAPVNTVDGRIYGLRRKGPYALYQAEEGARLIIQYANRPLGAILVEGLVNCFRPDLDILDDGRILIAYSKREGERPEDIVSFPIDPAILKQDLSKPVVVVPPPPPPPPPSPSEEEPDVDIPDHSEVVRQVDREFPHLLQKNTRETVKEFYWRAARRLYEKDPKWGMLSKKSPENGQEIPGAGYVAMDAVTYKGTERIRDIISGAGDETPTKPTWGDDGKRPSNVWVEPPPYPGQEEPQPEPEPEPEPPSNIEQILESHQQTLIVLAEGMDNLIREFKDLGEQFHAVKTQVAQLQGYIKRGDTVELEGRTGQSFGHSHPMNIKVVVK